MDAARQVAGDALRAGPPGGGNFDKWYYKILTHMVAFGLGMAFEHWRSDTTSLNQRVTILEEALKEIRKLK